MGNGITAINRPDLLQPVQSESSEVILAEITSLPFTSRQLSVELLSVTLPRQSEICLSWDNHSPVVPDCQDKNKNLYLVEIVKIM